MVPVIDAQIAETIRRIEDINRQGPGGGLSTIREKQYLQNTVMKLQKARAAAAAEC
jgi:hypothetical protein